MAIPEILIVLSSITMQDTIPKSKPAAATKEKVVVAADSLKNGKQTPGTGGTPVQAGKEAIQRKIKRGGWDRN